jgi:hypothetical protein
MRVQVSSFNSVHSDPTRNHTVENVILGDYVFRDATSECPNQSTFAIQYRRDVVRVSQCIELSISPVFSLLKPHSQSGTAQRIVKRWSMHRKDNTHLVDASVVDEVILPSNLAV